MWWVAERLAGRLQDVLEQLRRQGDGGRYVEAKSLETKGLRAMCQASLRVRLFPRLFSSTLTDALLHEQMSLLFPPVVPKFGSPVLAFDYAEERDQQRFEKRFGWLKGSLGAHELPLDGLASWHEFKADVAKLGEVSSTFPWAQVASLTISNIPTVSEQDRGSLACVPGCPRCPHRLCSHPPRSPWLFEQARASAQSNPLDFPSDCFLTHLLTSFLLQWVAAIRRTSFANSNLLGTVARQAAASVDTPQAQEEDVRWDCPWFPIWV